MIAVLLFVIEHAAALVLLLIIAAAAGTAVTGARAPLVLRATLGLAVAGQLFIVLATFGALRPWILWLVAAVAIAGAAMRMERGAMSWRAVAVMASIAAPLFVLALYPPIAFDETMYHLPFVRAIAGSGAIRFLPNLRFPAFPQLHELLCVPGYLLLGDVAPHLVALAELLLLAALLVIWPRQRHAGVLAAALLLGNPIVVQLATVTYVDCALALFITAGFYCLDRAAAEARWWYAAAGLLLGTACSVKYLGWYFAAAAGLWLLLDATRRRAVPLFLAALAVAAVPMYARIVALSGSPLFPFMPRIFGSSPWSMPSEAATLPFRLFWDITFARERAGLQPPYSPLFAVALIVTLLAARKDRRAAFIGAISIGYVAAFTFLPQDSRYLLPLLPLVSVVAANALANRTQLSIALAAISITGGLAYAGYRIVKQGPPPLTASARRSYLERWIPELRTLERRGPGPIYVCGAEQLQYYGGDDFRGDISGPFANARIMGGSRDAHELAGKLAALDVRYLLVSRRVCPQEWQRLPAAPEFERVYADGGAALWRLATPAR
jgi:hypothetical protein